MSKLVFQKISDILKSKVEDEFLFKNLSCFQEKICKFHQEGLFQSRKFLQQNVYEELFKIDDKIDLTKVVTPNLEIAEKFILWMKFQ